MYIYTTYVLEPEIHNQTTQPATHSDLPLPNPASQGPAKHRIFTQSE